MEEVYLINATEYDPARIAQAVKKAATELKVPLEQKSAVLLADCPWAHPKYAPIFHTHLGLIQGVAQALQPAAITIAANSLPGIPNVRQPPACRIRGACIPTKGAADPS